MATYLLTYNPEKGGFRDYNHAVKLTSKGQSYPDSWRVENGRISPGDRVFILRHGKGQPKGIMAEGFVTRGSYDSTADREGLERVRFASTLDCERSLVRKRCRFRGLYLGESTLDPTKALSAPAFRFLKKSRRK